MQINKQELDVQFVQLLPERETLFFNTWQGNAANVGVAQGASAGNGNFVNLGHSAAGNGAAISVGQVNHN